MKFEHARSSILKFWRTKKIKTSSLFAICLVTTNNNISNRLTSQLNWGWISSVKWFLNSEKHSDYCFLDLSNHVNIWIIKIWTSEIQGSISSWKISPNSKKHSDYCFLDHTNHVNIWIIQKTWTSDWIIRKKTWTSEFQSSLFLIFSGVKNLQTLWSHQQSPNIAKIICCHLLLSTCKILLKFTYYITGIPK